MNTFKRKVISTFNWLKFSLFVRKKFGKNSSESILEVVKLFIELELPLYKNTMYLGRDIKTSADLFKSLVDSYIKTKSEVTLNQVITVLKDEIIEREKEHGRQQFSGRPIRRNNS